MKLTYTNVNGYLIPNLTYKSGEQMEQLGKYGFLRRDYLKNHRNSTYQVMLLQDTIGEHLLEVDKAAREQMQGRWIKFIQPEKEFHHFGSVTSSGIIEGIRINIKSLCHFTDQIFFRNTNAFFILYNSAKFLVAKK